MARIWTNEMLDYLRTDGLNKSYKENIKDIEKLFGVKLTYNQIKSCRANRRISGKPRGHFKKGQKPFNKGLKWDDYLSKKSQENSRKTTFKKGQTPLNWKPVGSERIVKGGYIQVKIKEPDVWELKHRVIWEKHNGNIPESAVIIFKDGDPQNLDINNLEIITRDVNARLNKNGLRFEDADLTESGILVGKIMAEAGRRKHEKT